MPKNNERSAKFCRGAVEALEDLAIAFETPALRLLALECRNRAARYRTLLAEAEAREASQPTAAEVIEACEKALHHERQGLQNLIDFRGFWFGGERRYGALTMEELTDAMVRLKAVDTLCARWKEANDGQ